MESTSQNNRPLSSAQTQALQTEITTALGTLVVRVEPHQGKNGVFVMGTTGTGKSTISALLAGSQLTAQRIPSGQCVLKETNPQNTQITIGHGGRTGTTLLGSVYVQEKQLVVYDFQGFFDVRGPVPDIVNVASIHKLLESSRKVKVVAVLSQGLIKERGAASFPLFNLFNQLAEMFPDTTQLHSMVSLVITKKTSSFIPLVRLEEYVNDNDNALSSGGRGLLSYLCQHQSDRIAYLPKAKQEGPYTTDATDIWAKIEKAQYVQHPTANLAVPVGAREYLRSLSTELNKNIVDSLLNSSTSIANAFKQSNTALANNPDQLRHHLDARINEMNALAQILPGSDIDHIRSFTRIKGLPQETKAALVSFIDQIHILKGISNGMDGIKFDTLEWFKPLKDISIDWMDSIKNAEITRLDKEAALALATQKEQARLDALALVAQKEQALAQTQNNLNASQALAAERGQIIVQKDEALRQQEQALATITAQYNGKVNEIRILRETQQAEIQRLRETQQAEIQRLRETQQAEIQRLQNAHNIRINDKDTLIQALNQEKGTLLQTANQTLNTEKGKLNEQISQLQTANHYLQNEVNDLTKKRNDLTGEVDHKTGLLRRVWYIIHAYKNEYDPKDRIIQNGDIISFQNEMKNIDPDHWREDTKFGVYTSGVLNGCMKEYAAKYCS